MWSKGTILFILSGATWLMSSTSLPVDTPDELGLREMCNGVKTTSTREVNTTARLVELREKMKAAKVSAYIILSNDDHQSEYTSEHDKRREYITGFTGSAGDAVVTLTSAALWTDSRYYIQADNQIDCNWLLMKSGEPTTPPLEQWIASQLKPGDVAASDPRICTIAQWTKWNQSLSSGENSIVLKVITENLIDQIWDTTNGRSPYSDAKLTILNVKYAGVRWQDKLAAIRGDMEMEGVDTLVLTALDENAWVLNLRSDDVPYTPVFRSYMIITKNDSVLYVPREKITDEVRIHLNADSSESGDSVRIKDYADVWTDLPLFGTTSTKIGLPGPFSYAVGVSYLIYNSVPHDKIKSLTSPALLRKDIKNDAEAVGMRNAHIRDAVALCQFWAQLEAELKAGDQSWTELKAADILSKFRFRQPLNMGLSFYPTVAFGPNAALPHYTPTEETNKKIDTTQVLLVDSGGQYSDGTTDVTRTFHFGTPRDFEKKVYTKLLLGCIDLATVTFRTGYKEKELEILVRGPLFSMGLDYGHGSTHGIGSYLAVHEAYNVTYHLNFFGSQEPGYYLEDDFGVRLENIVTVVRANTTAENFLTFDAVTLVPYDINMIDVTLLENKHLNWINNYHKRVLKLVGDEMLQQGLQKEYDWLVLKTTEIVKG